MKRQVLIATTVLLTLAGGFAPESIAASIPVTGDSSQTAKAEDATPSGVKQNANRDRQRQQEAARRERERQRQAEMQEQWQDDQEDDDDRRDDDWWRDRNDDRWDDSEDYWEDGETQQERDREEWEEQRGDRDWQQRQNSRYWEEQRRDWENQRRDWEYRNDWWRSNGETNWQSTVPVPTYAYEGTRLELTSLSQEWVTVSIESVHGEHELSFTGSNSQQTVYLAPGAYRLRFRPTLSSRPWRSGYLEVGQTNFIRVVFDQSRGLVQVYDAPSAWVSE
ncbi:hypothetical protein H6G89_24060 [Oscillatoria sp. FACHB-1407]|uniref:hypothetical protein n=1 Tax=Oscillatoria sp. FACHB-1407 TaxID=2692847 RepID=UPI0016851905|nr:hypothetical protein [Oscillatoria sp. FACHB-1407]MBD2464081.1 hypothetical protein [Oscillatoria sp. FACHB-1407]